MKKELLIIENAFQLASWTAKRQDTWFDHSLGIGFVSADLFSKDFGITLSVSPSFLQNPLLKNMEQGMLHPLEQGIFLFGYREPVGSTSSADLVAHTSLTKISRWLLSTVHTCAFADFSVNSTRDSYLKIFGHSQSVADCIEALLSLIFVHVSEIRPDHVVLFFDHTLLQNFLGVLLRFLRVELDLQSTDALRQRIFDETIYWLMEECSQQSVVLVAADSQAGQELSAAALRYLSRSKVSPRALHCAID